MKKLNLSIGLFCAAAFLSLWCSPANAGVCFVVGGNCGQTVEAKDCTKLGYNYCDAATKEGVGKSCTSAGKNYYEKCRCKKSVFPVKASEVGEKYDGVSPQCSDDEGIHYTYKKCKDIYKYYEGMNSSGSVRIVYREDKRTKAISCLEGAKADGDSCKMLYNATETLYEKCSCNRNIYKLNNKTESWYTLGGKCEDSSGNIYYSTANCASPYTQVSCSGNNVSENTKTLYDYTGSTFKICYKCREKTCGEYGSYYADEPSCKSAAGATQTCAEVDKSLTGTRKCFKKIDITCPTGYYKTCPSGKECDTIAASNDTTKTCYKEKDTCATQGGMTLDACKDKIINQTKYCKYISKNCYKVEDGGVCPVNWKRSSYLSSAENSYNIKTFFANLFENISLIKEAKAVTIPSGTDIAFTYEWCYKVRSNITDQTECCKSRGGGSWVTVASSFCIASQVTDPKTPEIGDVTYEELAKCEFKTVGNDVTYCCECADKEKYTAKCQGEKKCSDYNSEYMESCSATTGKKCETVDSSTVGGLTCYKLVSTSTGGTETPKSCPAADSSKFPSGKTCFYHTSPRYDKGDCVAHAAPGSGTNNAGNGCYYICCSEGSSGATGGLVVGPGGTGGGGNTELPGIPGEIINM